MSDMSAPWPAPEQLLAIADQTVLLCTTIRQGIVTTDPETPALLPFSGANSGSALAAVHAAIDPLDYLFHGRTLEDLSRDQDKWRMRRWPWSLARWIVATPGTIERTDFAEKFAEAPPVLAAGTDTWRWGYAVSRPFNAIFRGLATVKAYFGHLPVFAINTWAGNCAWLREQIAPPHIVEQPPNEFFDEILGSSPWCRKVLWGYGPVNDKVPCHPPEIDDTGTFDSPQQGAKGLPLEWVMSLEHHAEVLRRAVNESRSSQTDDVVAVPHPDEQRALDWNAIDRVGGKFCPWWHQLASTGRDYGIGITGPIDEIAMLFDRLFEGTSNRFDLFGNRNHVTENQLFDYLYDVHGMSPTDAANLSLEALADILRGDLAHARERETGDIATDEEQETKPMTTLKQDTSWDVFISHASEDKADIARPLTERLQSVGLRVWFDEMMLTVGDSLHRKIEEGLRNSRFGIVILSHDFFAKEWPQRELDGLFALETGEKKILPVWHQIDVDEIRTHSPILADRVGTLTSNGLDVITNSLVRVIDPSLLTDSLTSEDANASILRLLPDDQRGVTEQAKVRDTEYELYRDLWDKLFELRRAIGQVVNPFARPEDAIDDEQLRELFNAFQTVVHKAEPFVAATIYQPLREIVTLARNIYHNNSKIEELYQHREGPLSVQTDERIADEQVRLDNECDDDFRKINELYETVSQAIRERAT